MEMAGGERRERGDEGESGTKDTERTGRGEVEEGGKVFNVFPFVTLCTLDIVCGEYNERSGRYCSGSALEF